MSSSASLRPESVAKTSFRSAILWPCVAMAIAVGSTFLAQAMSRNDAFNAPNPHAQGLPHTAKLVEASAEH